VRVDSFGWGWNGGVGVGGCGCSCVKMVEVLGFASRRLFPPLVVECSPSSSPHPVLLLIFLLETDDHVDWTGIQTI